MTVNFGKLRHFPDLTGHYLDTGNLGSFKLLDYVDITKV